MLNFNSIKVRLERADDAATAQVNLYFNSIKVRLEQSVLLSLALFEVFQFHKGTIRTLQAHRPADKTGISIP